MKPTRIFRAVLKAVRDRQPILLLGAAGTAKSAIVAQVAKFMKMSDPDFRLVDVRMTLYQPVDVKGMPTVDLKEMLARWTKPDFFRMIEPGSRGILFLDEITAARPEVQAALYELVYDRRIGAYSLPDGWSIVAAGNRVGDRAVAYEMPTPLKSRFVTVTIEVDPDGWRSWAEGEGLEPSVIAFIHLRPNMLHTFDPAAKQTAFACPRTVEMVARAVMSGIEKDIEFDYIAGLAGEGWATEYLGFQRLFATIDPDAVLADPTGYPLPDNQSLLYALTIVLARTVEAATFDAFFRFADRIAGDFSVLMVTTAVRKNPSILKTRGFIAWAAAHKDVLI